jgi:hypothetical protein
MMLPGFLTVHVIGYGVAGLLLTGTGAVLIHEHDSRIRAEVQAQERAKATEDADTLRTRLMEAAVAAVARRVDTVTVALRPIIQRTNTIIDSARRRPTDTALVQRALSLADTSSRKCTDLILSCDAFKKIATDSIRGLANLVAIRDHEKLVAVTPPSPRITQGIQLGAGACIAARKVGGKESLFGAPCISATYGIQVRIGR